MNRLAVLVALTAGTLGSGCNLFDQPGNISFFWTFAHHAPAQTGGLLRYDVDHVGGPTSDAGLPCPQSRVDTVRVTDPNDRSVDYPCVRTNGAQGVALLNVGGGTYTFRLRGLRGDTVVYDTKVNVHVNGNVNKVVEVKGVEAALDLSGALAHGASPGTAYATCADAGDPTLTYEIRDVYGSPVVKGSVACGDPLPASVFSGALDLDDYYVRIQGLDAGQAVVLDSCWLALAHLAAQTGADGLTRTLLTDPVPVCSSPFET